MGLLAKTISDTFSFFRNNFLKIFLYQLFFLIFYGIGLIIILVSILFFQFTQLLLILPIFLIGTIIMGIFYFVQLGGYPLIVKQGEKTEILKIFKISIKKIHKIIAVSIIEALPILIVLAIAFLGFYFIFFPFLLQLTKLSLTGRSIFPLFSITDMVIAQEKEIQTIPPDIISLLGKLSLFILFLIPIGLIGVYINIRLWFSVPILMIEEKGCIESLKRSWNLTRKKFWSIFFTGIVVSLVVGIASSIVGIPFNFIGLSFISNLIYYLIFYPIVTILPTIYYYNVKKKKLS